MVDRALERRRARGRRPPRPDRPGAYFEPTIIANPRPATARSSRTRSSGRSSPSSASRDEEQAVAVGERRQVRPGERRCSRARSAKAMRVARRLQFGTVWINEHFTLASETPHGGVKESGYGKDGSSTRSRTTRSSSTSRSTRASDRTLRRPRADARRDAAAVRALDLDDARRAPLVRGKGACPRPRPARPRVRARPTSAVLALVDLSSTATRDRPVRDAVRPRRRRRCARPPRATARGGRSASAIAEGRTIAALTAGRATVGASAERARSRPRPSCAGRRAGLADVVARRAGRVAGADEAALGRDQSNTSVVLGERLLLKALPPDPAGPQPRPRADRLPVRGGGVPGRAAAGRLGGGRDPRRRGVDGRDAPGVRRGRRRRVRDDRGVPRWPRRRRRAPSDLECGDRGRRGPRHAGRRAARRARDAAARTRRTSRPREATHDELRAWRLDAHAAARPAALGRRGRSIPSWPSELRRDAPAIAARVSRFEAVADDARWSCASTRTSTSARCWSRTTATGSSTSRASRCGRSRTGAASTHRCVTWPRCSARSTTSARSARRRAEARAGGPHRAAGARRRRLDRARARPVPRRVCRGRCDEAGAPIAVDLDLLDAFEVAKEAYEFEYAATVLPSWLWAPREGMRWLLARGGST